MNREINVRPISGALGAEIEGVDLSQDLSNEAFDKVHRAFLDHHVIFFRDQNDLSPERHKAFGRRFGSLNVHPYVKGMEGHPEILEIIKEPEERINFGGGWHSDMSYIEKPALGSILHAIEVPDYGGDTLFANQMAAYDALSEGMKAMLGDLTAIHSASREYSARGQSAQARKSMDTQTTDEAPEYEHPVVRTHPETGRRALFLGDHAESIEGMPYDEGRALIESLNVMATPEDRVYRHRWQPGDIVMWDNRCTMHRANHDYGDQPRRMNRILLAGDRPV